MDEHQNDFNPFQSPDVLRSQVRGSATPYGPRPRHVIPYESAGTRAVFAQIGLASMAFFTLVMIYNSHQLYKFVGRAIAHQPVTREEGVALDRVTLTIQGIQLLFLIPTAIAFGMWVHRTYRNLPALGVRWLAGSPAFAVGGFYIPIASYYYSYSAIREIWNGSDPDPPASFGPPNQFSPPVFGWWFLFYGAELIRIGARFLLIIGVSSKNLHSMSTGVILDQVANGMRLLAALAMIAIVYVATRRQNDRNDLHSWADDDGPEPILADRADQLDQPWLQLPPNP